MNEEETFSQEMFAARHPDRGWQHFFLSRNAYTLTGDHPSTVRRVRVIVDPEGPFWGWRYALSHDSFSGQISMIFSRRLLVEVCFPYGTKAAEEKGEGRVVRLRVEDLGE